MHHVIDPAILYFGTPVVLVSTLNPDGTPNLAPMSSAWWLGRSCMLGFGARSQTPANLLRTGECVLNLPSVEQVDAVNRLVRTTGSDPVPPHKDAMGYRHVRDKFAEAGMTPVPADTVSAPRVLECPIHLEARLVGHHPLALTDARRRGTLVALEVEIVRVHVQDALRLHDQANRIDPDRWRPLIMSFQQLYGLTARVADSALAQISEERYRLGPVTRVAESASRR
jgi:flavin reductase (DIM6/NTAB) family NADH-FMN oxidoreductase RutF